MEGWKVGRYLTSFVFQISRYRAIKKKAEGWPRRWSGPSFPSFGRGARLHAAVLWRWAVGLAGSGHADWPHPGHDGKLGETGGGASLEMCLK